MTTRWKLTIEYDGAPFSGWQRQKSERPTVQGAIEAALKAFCGQDIALHVAGRTDAGVHARGQVAHFDLDYGGRPLSGFDLAKALNALLRPHPVAILRAEPASPDFHARFGAKVKLYQYRILQRSAPPALEAGKLWHIKKPLALAPMQAAAVHLIGRHDFTTFRDSACQAKSPIRSILRADIDARPYDHLGGTEYAFSFEGRSFLHHQVRNMVGSLSLVGLGKWSPEDFAAAMAACDRTRGGPNAPADGLHLIHIDYDAGPAAAEPDDA